MQGRKTFIVDPSAFLIAFVSLQMMTSQNHTEKRRGLRWILPKRQSGRKCMVCWMEYGIRLTMIM